MSKKNDDLLCTNKISRVKSGDNTLCQSDFTQELVQLNEKADSNNIINSLIIKAKNKKINLKGFAFLASQPYKSHMENVIFRKACIMLETLIDKEEFPKYVKNVNFTQIMLDGKTYLTKNDPEFKKATKKH